MRHGGPGSSPGVPRQPRCAKPRAAAFHRGSRTLPLGDPASRRPHVCRQPHTPSGSSGPVGCRRLPLLPHARQLRGPPPRPRGQTGGAGGDCGQASGPPLTTAPPLPEAMARDRRDRAHLLLVERRPLIDRVFLTLPSSDQENVAELVSSMAAGMLWAADAFEAQGGVLETEEQLSRYCHHVIGEPVLFALRLVLPGGVTEARRRDAMAVSEMIQLANITRDIERDAERGIAYHPALRPLLSGARDGGSLEAVRSVREELLVRALGRASAYRRLCRAQVREIQRCSGRGGFDALVHRSVLPVMCGQGGAPSLAGAESNERPHTGVGACRGVPEIQQCGRRSGRG